MAVTQPATLIGEITDFLASSPTAEEIMAFKVSDLLQHRAHELLELNRENRLTPEERAEMEEFMRMEHFMSLLKVKIRAKLQLTSPS